MRLRFVLVVTLALAAAGALAFDGRGVAGGQIDLSGDWTVAVEGDVTLTCTISVQQAGNDLTARLNCPGVPEASLAGSVNAPSRMLRLNAEKKQTLDVDLEGTVSADGNTVDGTWSWSADRLTGTFHAVRGVEPPAVPDIAGSWHIWTTGDDTAPCDATVQQDGAAVELVLACPGQSSATFSGELDGQLLTLSGGPFFTILAFVSPDGLALGGRSFNSAPEYRPGLFTGLKSIERTLDGDITGDWRITITGGLLGTCDVAAQQSGSVVFAAFDCGVAGAWWLRGPIDAASGTFRLEGKAGSEGDYHAVIRGVMSEDGHSFSGNFAANLVDTPYWSGGTLAGEQVDDSPSFIDVNGQYDLRLASQLGETVPCQFDLQQQQEALSAATGCSGVGDGQLTGSINPLTGTFSMDGRIGTVEITLDGIASDEGGMIDLSGSWETQRRFVEGCFQTQVPITCNLGLRRVPGDLDCDGRTNSIDAALVLQYAAGLGSDLETFCSSNVFDLQLRCCPVLIDATDAAIILQLSAGLFGRLAG